MPKTVVISEVNPIAGGWGKERENSYMTIQNQSKHWHGIPLISEKYDDAAIELSEKLSEKNYHLIIRDWSYINFYPKKENKFSPSSEFLAFKTLDKKMNVKPFVFLRDGVDVWISNGAKNPKTFFTHYLRYLEEIRRNCFTIFKYEDFCNQPQQRMQELCGYLEIPFNSNFQNEYSAFEKVNGDVQGKNPSRGIASRRISLMSRKIINRSLINDLETCTEFQKCNEMFGYIPSYYNEEMKTKGFPFLKRKFYKRFSI